MRTVKIAVIGAGQLGSRHLQALAMMNRPTHLQVVDPSIESLQMTRERYEQITDAPQILRIDYLTKIGELDAELDLVVVATTSNVRRAVIEELLALKKVKYLILEKVLFQRKVDFYAIKELLAEKQVSAWVNCPRRMWPLYKQLKERLKDADQVHFSVSGAQWGLGSNAVHFLDLFSYLTSQYSIELSGLLIDKQLIENKRPGFIELTGALTGVSSRGSQISITSYAQGDAPLIVQINTAHARYLINEYQSKAFLAESRTGWATEEVLFQMPYQSQLTHLAAQAILDTQECPLSTYEEALNVHLSIIDAFNSHIQSLTSEGAIDRCPIT